MIGDATRWSEKFKWMPILPLSGKRVVVTRPVGTSSKLCKLLRDEGAVPIPLPTIEFETYYDEEGWDRFKILSMNSGWLVFTSGTGVDYFFTQLFEIGYDVRRIGNLKIAAIGHGTEERLANYHLKADLKPQISTIQNLAREISRISVDQTDLFIRVRGDLSDDTIEKEIGNLKLECLPITVYKTIIPTWEERWVKNVKENPPDYLTFTSGSTVDGFVKIIGSEAAIEISKKSSLVSIGPVTTESLHCHGLKADVEAHEHDVQGVVRAILELNSR